jgi:succinate-semialdehyde dehydrogenase/glutarate-semialdehyde dehydrogenase
MGLTNYVFTTNSSRAFRCTELLEAGTISVNTAMTNAAESPLGGIKESGLGKEGGYSRGVDKFCTTEAMAITLY